MSFSYAFLKDSFNEYSISSWQFFFFLSAVEKISTLFWLPQLHMKNSLSLELVAPTDNVSFRSGCSQYFLSLVFRSLIIMCPGMDFFEFILFGVCSVEILRFVLFTKFDESFQPLLLHILFQPHSFYFLSLIPKI